MELLTKILNSKILEKNTWLAFIVIIIIGLNVLKIDVNTYLLSLRYSMYTLININIVLQIVIALYISNRFHCLNSLNSMLEDYKDLISDSKEELDFIKFTITNISAEIKDLHKNQKEIILNIKGIPNIRFLQNNIELKTKELINQIMVESIETINDRNNINTNTLEIYNDKFTSKYLNYSKEYRNYIKDILENYNINSILIEKLNEILTAHLPNLLNEFDKSRKGDQKMIIISYMLKHLDEELCDEINSYLRNHQSSVF